MIDKTPDWWGQSYGRRRPWHNYYHPDMPAEEISKDTFRIYETCRIYWDNSFLDKFYPKKKMETINEFFDYPEGYIVKRFRMPKKEK